MTLTSRRFVLQGALFGVACACACAAVGAAAAQSSSSAPPAKPGQKYVCPPCGCAADGKEFDAPDACPECGMPLVPKAADGKPKEGAPAPKGAAAAQNALPATAASAAPA